MHHAANDNGPVAANDPDLLREAVMLFADRGFSAAHSARDNAQAALEAGDADSADRWLNICHLLDRREAAKAVVDSAEAV